MKLTFLLACLLFAALPAAAIATGEKQYPDYNFAITPPDDWQDTTASAGQKGVIASFGSPDHTRAVFILVEERAVPAGEWDDRFAAEFDRAAEPQLGKRLSGKFVVVQGIKSYERTSAPVVQGKSISLISRTTLVGKRFYSIQGYRFTGGDAGEDPQIREMLDSFHFLTPSATVSVATAATAAQPARVPERELPVLPPPASSRIIGQPAPAPGGEPPAPPVVISITAAQPTPAPRAERPPAPAASSATDTRGKDLDDAFQRGQAVGRMMTVLLIVGVPILVIVWLARRGKRRGPGVPPPAPPPPRPQSAPPPRPSVPKESRPPSPPAAVPAPLRAAKLPVPRATPPPPQSAPPPARPVTPPMPPTAPAPPSAPPTPMEPPPAPPAASPSPPAPSPAAPAPPQAPQPEPFVIRPRQKHMRE